MIAKIYSLKKSLFEGDVSLINCPTKAGEITILNNHLPLITSLKEGIIKIIDQKEKEYFFQVQGGFLEVEKFNQVKILVDEK